MQNIYLWLGVVLGIVDSRIKDVVKSFEKNKSTQSQ